MTSGNRRTTPKAARRPACAVECVIGANHLRSGKPCQDVAGCEVVSDTVALAVADGHGTSRHADVGARLAVQVALAALVRFAEDLGERTSNPIEVQKYAEHPLRAQLVREWKERVRAKAENDETPLREYGSTLLAAVATSDFLLLGQLGDGDVLLVDEDGTVDVPLLADPASFADETLSLCLPEAEHALRVRVLPAPERESLLLLSTDGYGKSYPTDPAFRQIGPDYLALVREHGVSGLTPLLRGFLEKVTVQGSGDDIALALLHWPAPASRTATDSSIVPSNDAPLLRHMETSRPDSPAKEAGSPLSETGTDRSTVGFATGRGARVPAGAEAGRGDGAHIVGRGPGTAGIRSRLVRWFRSAFGKGHGSRNEFTK